MSHTADTAHEDLLDVFRAAALSVTKLYKTSASAQAKARIDGYQDCLEDLLAVIDKGDVDLRTVRWWITERLEGREPILPTVESEDEVDKTDAAPVPSPQVAAATTAAGTPGGRNTKKERRPNTDVVMQTDQDMPSPTAARRTESSTPPAMLSSAATTGAPPADMSTAMAGKLRSGGPGSVKGVAATGSETTNTTPRAASPAATAAEATPLSSESESVAVEPTEVTVPMQDVFTFRSPMPYPPSESYLELANLDLSDRRSSVSTTADAATNGPGSPAASHTAPALSNTSPSSTRPFRVRHSAARSGLRAAALPRHGRNAVGQKRKLNFDEIFDLASIGYGKDMFGRGGNKRSRQT